LRQAHFPEEEDKLAAALGYLSFEALALRYAALKRFGNRRQTVPPMDCPDELADTFWAAQKFIPTNAQRRAALDILSDLRSGTAMSRLVEGDVGCGKTAVSFLALYAAAVNGAQGAMMAPTEILAEQHWRNAARMLEPLGVRCGLIKGGMTALNRRDAVRAIASGEWQAVFGTHALFSKDVIFNKLSIAITDEQHRFGVLQRAALAEKSEHTHSLVLSATPIPRTLALLMYGDLKVSIIDELPPGRVPIETRFVPEYKREGLYKFIRKQAELGYQTYIICPHATDSSSEDCACAQWLAEELRGGALNGLRVGLAHGGQSSKLRSETLEAFHKGMMDVLVATTVVEVGVDSPRATVMVIENPERYGLAQLHQLRGRVGRGTISSWCFLMGEPNERLTVLARTRDGFEIARKDLEMRGAGDLLGVRQHGLQKTDLAFSSADPETLDRVKSSVDELLDRGGNEADLLISAAKSKFGDVMSIGAN
jgi:ATP-dependent DNA helicase RecG